LHFVTDVVNGRQPFHLPRSGAGAVEVPYLKAMLAIV
jgi:hypothetical protein